VTTSRQKAGKGSSPQKHKTGKPAATEISLLSFALHVIAGAALFYFLQSIQVIGSQWSGSVSVFFTLLCGILGGVGTLPFFKKVAHQVAIWSLPLLILHVLLNVALTYQWMERSEALVFLAKGLTFPLGILWYFILKYKAESQAEPSTAGEYSVKQVFSGITPKVVAILILMISSTLIFYRLGYFDIWEDENLVINAAKGVYEQGIDYLDTGYDRAWLHTLLCAGVFEVFGVSEFTGRLPSAIFGLLFVIACFVVFARWYGLAWIALLIPIICLMNDRFLLLFRYMRMYAILIPLFLIGVYVIHKTIKAFQDSTLVHDDRKRFSRSTVLLAVLAIAFMPLLIHIHKLSAILLPVFGLFIVYQVLQRPTKGQLRLLYIVSGLGVILLLLTFVAELEALKMFRAVTKRILAPQTPMPAYFEFMLGNGLPVNSTLMILLAGLGLIPSKVTSSVRHLVVFNYLLITMALVSMVFLISNEGRDYRYIAHIVPFVVCTLLLVVYQIGKVVWKKSYPWLLMIVLGISSLDLIQDYERIYIRHPWAPRYSAVYKTLKDNFKPGDALFAQNIKTYYLDPEALAGDKYYKISKKEGYAFAQFSLDLREARHGWIMWELHKSHHWPKDILAYIYKHFKPYHTQQTDDLGVALYYFDETMLPPE
jgi:hypothetical protein